MSNNSSHSNWNIPNQDEGPEVTPRETELLDQVFTGSNFSALGGGDAPMVSNTPRLRSRLFTISTRSVMASHSQLNVSYTTSTTSVDPDTMHRHFMPKLPSPESAALLEDEVKPLNTEVPHALTQSSLPLTSENKNSTESQIRASLLQRRCFHSSLENVGHFPRRGNKNCDKNRRKSAPTIETKGQMMEAANALLVDENKHLCKSVTVLRKKTLASKIALCFAMKALNRRGKVIKKLEIVKLEKEQQCAARLILHSLLLNSWRNTKRELNMRIDDNVELRKSVENFTLQVQVLRHIQTSERQKSQEKSVIIENLNDELGIVKEENSIMQKEIEKMESKLNSLQASAQNLSDENEILNQEITNVTENRDKLMHSLERERLRSDQFGRDNEAMKETLKHLEHQLKDTADQKSHWQERARCSESETWELQLHLDTRNSNILQLRSECDILKEEKIKLIEESYGLKSDLETAKAALQTVSEKTDELVESHEKVKAERDMKTDTIQQLEKSLITVKKDCKDLEKELWAYKLQNVRRRREWGNALYFIVSPMDKVRRILT